MGKIFQKGKIFGKVLYLSFLLLLAFVLDFFLFAITSACPGCAGFSQWLASPFSLSYPLFLALVALISPRFSPKKRG